MTRDEMTKLAHRMYEAANVGDLDAVDSIFAADFRSHPMGTTGPAAVRQAWAAIHQKYPDLRVSVEDMLADGDKLAVRTAVHGTSPDAAGDPPTIMEIIRIADGQIAELWGVTNLSWR